MLKPMRYAHQSRRLRLLKLFLKINNLFNMILYVRGNEETSHLKIVHFHSGDIPSEMEANARSKYMVLHFCP